MKGMMINHVRSEANGILQCRHMNCVRVTLEDRSCEGGDDQSCEE